MGQSKKAGLPRICLRAPKAFHHRVQDAKTRLRRKDRWFYDGEPLTQEALVAAALLEFMGLDEKHQAKVLDKHLPAMEAMFLEMSAEAARRREGDP